MNSKYEIQIMSDVDFEELIAEISYEGKFIALIDQDEGKDNLRIRFSDSLKDLIFSYAELLDALSEAKKKLLQEHLDSEIC